MRTILFLIMALFFCVACGTSEVGQPEATQLPNQLQAVQQPTYQQPVYQTDYGNTITQLESRVASLETKVYNLQEQIYNLRKYNNLR